MYIIEAAYAYVGQRGGVRNSDKHGSSGKFGGVYVGWQMSSELMRCGRWRNSGHSLLRS